MSSETDTDGEPNMLYIISQINSNSTPIALFCEGVFQAYYGLFPVCFKSYNLEWFLF